MLFIQWGSPKIISRLTVTALLGFFALTDFGFAAGQSNGRQKPFLVDRAFIETSTASRIPASLGHQLARVDHRKTQ